MKKKKLCLFIMLFGAVTAQAQYKIKIDREAAEIMTANTGAATTEEKIYKKEIDKINADKVITFADATIRYTMKMADKSERERIVFNRNSRAYLELVRQCGLFTKDMSQMMELAVKHPTKMATCVASGADMLEQAYAVVKHAIVVGMNNKVPLPWKVDLDKLLKGKDNTPDYGSDSERDKKKDDDGDNMLLPDERYRIINNAIYRLRDMRRSLHVVTIKLGVDFNFRQMMEKALPYNRIAFKSLESSYKNIGNYFAGCPGL